MEEKGDLKRIVSGDMQAFERIFMRYQPKLIAFLKGFLQEEEVCRDMAQDIFLDIWEKRYRLAYVESFAAYLFQIGRYQVYNYYDRLIVHEKYALNQILHPSPAETVEESLFLQELQSQIESYVNQMSTQRQRIFRMSRYEGLSNEEISRKLNLNKRTVENNLSLALSELRKVLLYLCFFC